MKRLLTVLCAVMLLTACAENPKIGEQSVSISDVTINDPFAETSQTDDDDPFAETSQTDDDDPFAQSNEKKKDEPDGAWTQGVEWKKNRELVLDYAPTVTFPYYIENGANRNDFGLLIFVNGFRQTYRTDTEPDDRVMHTFVVNQNETIHSMISFDPIVGHMGETLSVEIIGMFQPSFTLTDQTTHAALNFHHRIISLFPSDLTVTQKTDLKAPAVCSEYTEVPITEDIKDQYQNNGENMLDKASDIFLEALKNDILITPGDRVKAAEQGKEIKKTVFSGNDKITLCMFGGGKPCKYRISMYLNHELVHGVFDGYDYIDMMPSADIMCRKEIDMSKLKLPQNEFSHFYYIAVPFYTNKNYAERMTVKSESAAISNS